MTPRLTELRLSSSDFNLTMPALRAFFSNSAPRQLALSVTLFLAGVLSAQSSTHEIPLDEGQSQKAWTFSPGAEFPGARGKLHFKHDEEKAFGEIEFDFTPHETVSGKFNPQYVFAEVPVQPTAMVAPARITLNLQLSGEYIKPRLRVVDSTGQTLQYNISLSSPLTSFSTDDWQVGNVNLNEPKASWGGAHNRMFNPPIQTLSIVADASNFRGKGWLRFAHIALLDRHETAAITLEAGTLVPPSQPTPFAEHTGINIHFTKDERSMRAITTVGFKWIRTDLTWEDVEKTRGHYDFSAYDELVATAQAHHLHVLGILDYGNPLYTGGAMKPPVNDAELEAFKAYCQAAAAHFAKQDVVFEIWNEPDVGGFWDKSPNAAQFAKLLRAGISGVKAGNPAARVLTAGLSQPYSVTYKFWDTVSRSGAMEGADGWGTHLYIDERPEQRWTDILKLRERAAHVLPGKDVWCTEWGFSSAKLSATHNGHEELALKKQAVLDARELLLGWWAHLPLTVVYDIRDDGLLANETEHNFGLLTKDYREKPAFVALRTLFKMTQDRTIAGLMKYPEIPAGFHAMKLNGGESPLYIIWADEDAPRVNVTLPGRAAHVWNTWGETVETNGTTLDVGPDDGIFYASFAN